MTMSGSNQTVPSVPLDLTNKTRERGSSAQPGEQGRPGHAPERQVDPPACKCSNGHRIAPLETQGNCYESVSQTDDVGVRENRTREGPKQTRPITPSAKCNNPPDAAGKPSDRPANNLPLRKRPYHLDVEHDSSNPKTVPCSPGPEPKLSRKTDRALIDTEAPWIPNASHPSYCYPFMHRPQHYPQKSITMLVPAPDQLLADIAAATHQDEDGDTPLHIAVVKENINLVFFLIEIFRHGQKHVDIFNNLRQTPLHLAAITHQPILVKALLDARSDPGALDRNGQTALHLCCEHGEANGLDIILRHYSHNPSPHLEIRNYEGLTPLHLAVQNGDKTLAKILLDNGAEINAGDNKSGRSPLIHAVENNSTGIVMFLIERGCDVNAQSYSGNTALHSACGRGHIEIVRILLKNGADSSLKNNHNDTAIMVAKNKKVSDVLRGKGTRSYTPKTLSSSNCSLSPGSSSHSPRMTPTFQRSASQSPVTPVLPRSQSMESISERQSPLNSNEKTLFHMLPRTNHNIAVDNRPSYGMALHTFPYLAASGYDQMMPSVQRRTLIASPLYCPPGFQRPPYYSDAPIILVPGFPMPVTYSSTQGVFNQSRPSSRSSDQSDMSTVSVNSDERGMS